MLKVLCGAVAGYVVVGVATAVAMFVWWAYERYAGAYRYKREELPMLWELLLICVLIWPLVVYLLAAEAADRTLRPRR